jgi:hypothetical protein
MCMCIVLILYSIIQWVSIVKCARMAITDLLV